MTGSSSSSQSVRQSVSLVGSNHRIMSHTEFVFFHVLAQVHLGQNQGFRNRFREAKSRQGSMHAMLLCNRLYRSTPAPRVVTDGASNKRAQNCLQTCGGHVLRQHTGIGTRLYLDIWMGTRIGNFCMQSCVRVCLQTCKMPRGMHSNAPMSSEA